MEVHCKRIWCRGGGGGGPKMYMFSKQSWLPIFLNQILVLILKIKTFLTRSQYLAGISIMAESAPKSY